MIVQLLEINVVCRLEINNGTPYNGVVPDSPKNSILGAFLIKISKVQSNIK